jgi:hypothetical protein
MSAGYRGTTHTKPDTSHLVWRVADKARDEELQIYRKNRCGNAKAVAVHDILALGEKKLKSSSLGTFNRKIFAMVNCRLYDPEPTEDTDTLPPLALGRPSDSDSSDLAVAE